jgi:predicted DNA-binding protein (UPF0251 family)
MSPRDLRPILERAVARLQARAAALEERVEAGDESAWSAYVEAVEALAAVLPRLDRGADGALLSTAEMAHRLGVAPKTLLRHVARGSVTPALRRGKLIRWKGTEVPR